MAGLIVLFVVFLFLRFVFRTVAAPSQSAASLRRIENELKSRR